MTRHPDVERVGQLIADRYRIDQVLGRGGMAVVYRVFDLRTKKPLALKRGLASDPGRSARYASMVEREYHTLAQLAHPCIIAVYDFGRDAQGPYYTMELLQGSDLERVDRLPWERACVALYDVASSLALLHWRGLLHRDVSMRNVHWSENGRAKLIDFGAMASMGVPHDAVGTPPYMAPEVLQLQALDARVDLFSLGALAYRLLTGRHAFPARRISELRDLWRSRPTPPNLVDSDVPEELSALVMRLLAIDRGARPQSAAHVMEPLRALANLESEDTQAISRACLTMPSLVGRDRALLEVRKHMLSLVRGDGGAIAVRGVPGAGRSRMLDACALDGKLLGAAVVRADARDASAGSWGVARAIGKQLLAQFPKQASEAARLSRHVLCEILEEFRSDDTLIATGHIPSRNAITRELRDWILSLSKVQRLLLVVDDAERIDSSSLSLLAALAHKAERNPILLAFVLNDDAQRALSPALDLLEQTANAVQVEQLRAEDTENMLRAVFGDVPNLPLCAGRIHALSQGNPRAVMELAQHLVNTGRARYAAGSWVLPDTLSRDDLPDSLAASLSVRLKQLSQDARELADILALADEDRLLVGTYAGLTQHGNARRVFQALDELVTARILIGEGDRYYFTQRGFLSVLNEALPSARRQQVHRRIAALLARTGADPLGRVSHLLECGQDAAAVELLGGIDLGAHLLPAPLLLKAVERAERLDVSAVTLHRLRLGVLMSAPSFMDYESFRRVAPVVLTRLEHDSGLMRYRELSDLPEEERLAQALAQTQQKYLATPQDDRVYTAFEAVRELARLSGAISRMAMPALDLELIEGLPSLEPLYSLSPSLPIVAQIAEAGAEWVRGRILRTRSIAEGVLSRIAAPDRGGLDDAQHERVRLGMQATLGIFEAGLGVPAALERAKLIERHQALRIYAWRIRGLFQLALGNIVEADQCTRRAAVLQVQSDDAEAWVDSTTGWELVLRSRLGDLVGVKSLLEKAASLADRHEGWRPVELLGRSRFSELQGDLVTALRLAEAALELAKPLRNPFFASLAASHIALLMRLDRTDESIDRALRYTELCQREELAAMEVGLEAALALAHVGRCDEALRVLTPLLQEAEELQQAGYAVGVLYEARARIAIAADDQAAFQLAVERCTREYNKAENPWLGARLQRLFDEAREHRMPPSEEASRLAQSFKPAAPAGRQESVQSRIAECLDEADRARCILTLLLQHLWADAGSLYVVGASQTLQLVATLPDAPGDPEVAEWVGRYARSSQRRIETKDEASTANDSFGLPDTRPETASCTDSVTASGSLVDEAAQDEHLYVDHHGRQLEALPLFEHPDRREGLAAVLVLESQPGRTLFVSQHMSASVVRELVEYGDAIALLP